VRGDAPATGDVVGMIVLGVIGTALLIGTGVSEGGAPSFPLKTSRVGMTSIPEPTGTLDPVLEGEVCWVDGSVVNVRTGPSTGVGVSGKVHDGDVLRCFEPEKGWHRIEKRAGLFGQLQVSGYIRDDLLDWESARLDDAVRGALATEDRSGPAAAYPSWQQALELGQDSTEAWWSVTDAWLAMKVGGVQSRGQGQGQGRGQSRLRAVMPCRAGRPTPEALYSMARELTTDSAPTFFVIAPSKSRWLRVDLGRLKNHDWVGGVFEVDEPGDESCGTKMVITGRGTEPLTPALFARMRDRAVLDRLVVVER
jgi:hypothetical protein